MVRLGRRGAVGGLALGGGGGKGKGRGKEGRREEGGRGREGTLAGGLVDVVEFGDLREAEGVAQGFAMAGWGEEFDVGHFVGLRSEGGREGGEDRGKRGFFCLRSLGEGRGW